MATVYLATDLRHERKVALKVLKPELAAVVGSERFLAEIKVTANLQHPHILPLFDSGDADGFLFYVMPYVQGDTLRNRLERERQLPVEEAVRIATAVAQALQHAHEHGVVHRDIKPANILLQDGQPVVADFGIALAVGAAGGSRLTETGLSVGTPYYMSPEQATGDQQVGPRSDVYALAAVTYEMLVGDPPYMGSTAQAVLGQIIRGKPVSTTEKRSAVPAHVDSAIRRALEKLPADRFADANGFAAALVDPSFRHGGALAAVGGGTSSGPWKGLSLGLAVLSAVLLAWTGWSALRQDSAEGVHRQQIVLWKQLMSFRGGQIPVADVAAIAPDGSAIAFVDLDVDAGTSRIFLKPRNQAIAAAVAGTEGARSVAFSPDAQWLAYGTVDGLLRKVRSAGGGSVTLAEDMAASFAAPHWSDDGTIFYIDASLRIAKVDENGNERELVLDPNERLGLTAGTIFSLPDGRGLLFSGCTGNCNQSYIYLYDVEADTTALLFEDAYGAWYLPTGHVVYVSLGGGAYAAAFDPSKLAVTGGAVPVLEGVAPNGLLFNREGTALYGVGGVGANELVWVTREGGVSAVDPDWQGLFNYPALSPDGTRLAVSVNTAGEEQIWIKQLDRGPEEKLTSEGNSSFRPAWTPDGTAIAYVVGGDDLSRDLYRRRADGSAEPEVLLDLSQGVWEVQYSYDGRWLLYRIDNPWQGDLFALSLEAAGDTLVLLSSEYDERQLALSPDGRWIAYISDRSGRYEVYVRPFPNSGDGRWVISSDGGSEPLWSPDGRELFFREGALMKSVEILPGEPFRTGEVRELFSVADYLGAYNRRQYDVAPGAGRFLMIRPLAAGALDLVHVEGWFDELKDRMRR